jgi:putative ABC transport system permease protein
VRATLRAPWPTRPPPAVAPVAIVSRSLAERLAPGEIGNALGQEVTIGSQVLRIVGVVENVHFGGPFEDETHRFELYRPLAQFPRNLVSLFAEIPGDPRAYVPTLRTQIARIAPTSAVDWVGPVLALLFTLFGGTCLVLTVVGVAGITATGVARRTRELAIREALGATAGALQLGIVARAVRLAVVGVIVGVAGTAASARVMRAAVGDLRVNDPTILVVAAGVLVAATAAAAWIPSRRVTRIHPATALKE